MTASLGRAHPDTQSQLRIAAHLRGRNGQTAESVKSLTSLLAESESLFGRQDDGTRVCREYLAEALERDGDVRGALRLVNQAIVEEEQRIFHLECRSTPDIVKLRAARERLTARV
ncbi:hypothetical protein [Streptomyces sp. ALI-76-A]|uniref:hypothetical protein n=1 Tax=Streptomyces sp. ALI-76-A TaxID=3025736 RepID=UPI00256EFF24|nr:hypothetical protein [Streptomyces sp. ALI-76-A]MDL5199218.1 hypothetical protein [Streptomyces sp. ALI-76-A]